MNKLFLIVLVTLVIGFGLAWAMVPREFVRERPGEIECWDSAGMRVVCRREGGR